MSHILDIPLGLAKKYACVPPHYVHTWAAKNLIEGFSATDYQLYTRKANQELLPSDLSLSIHTPNEHPGRNRDGCHPDAAKYQGQQVKDYLKLLLKEIELHSELVDNDRRVTQIHFAAGTYGYLSGPGLADVLERIAGHFQLYPPTQLEISLAVDSGAIDADSISALAELGVNRFNISVAETYVALQPQTDSLGLQFDALQVISAASKTKGLVNVVINSGAQQLTDGLVNSVEQIIGSGVSGIVIDDFIIAPATVDANPEQALSNRVELRHTLRKIFHNAGLIHIGLDHYAWPEDRLASAHRNNALNRCIQGYTTHPKTDQIGVGVGAISRFKDARTQNATELSAYQNFLNANILPVQKGFQLSNDDILRSAVIQHVLCRNSVDLSVNTRVFIEASHPTSLQQYLQQDIDKLLPCIEDGLLELTNIGFNITSTGSFLRRQIAAIFAANQLSREPKPDPRSVVHFL